MTQPDSHPKPQADAVVRLLSTVVEGGYCIGCGMCAAFSSSLTMQMNDYGCWQAVLADGQSTTEAGLADTVCPFADGVPSEDELAGDLFPSASSHKRIGRYLTNYAGHVQSGSYRARASSGGLATWLLCRLIEEDHVDAIIHVGATPGDEDGPLFRFCVSRSVAEVQARAKSRYYPVEMSGVVSEMLNNPGRYAVVGLPCFIKALRLACRQSSVLHSRVAHTIGIVCGHLKSRGFAEMMAWQCGIEPWALKSFDFRTKRSDAPANHYGITAGGAGSAGELIVTKPVTELFGTNWGYGFFKYQACDFCDDVLAETADVAVGDAWLPEYVTDSGGASIVTVRTAFFRDLLEKGIASGALKLQELPADRVAESQDAGLRHRREGLSCRLQDAEAAGVWAPTKRVRAGEFPLSERQRAIFRLRQELAKRSHEAFLKAKRARRFEIFPREMRGLMKRYDAYYIPSLRVRVFAKLKKVAKWILSPILARSGRAASQ